jgi:methyltransferase (TIGR00027 family)
VVKEWKPSRTAQAVAAERALLSDLRVLDDPFAAAMLSPAMASVYGVVRRLPHQVWSRSVTLAGLAGRVLWFDGEVADAIGSGVEQVVTVGAGYDSRPWRFSASGVRFFELDHPATQADKRRRAPGQGPVFAAADLIDDDVGGALLECGFDREAPAVFIVEGVTMYLDEVVVRRQLMSLAEIAAPGSRLAVDFYPSSRPDTGVHRRQLMLQRIARVGSNEGFRLGVDRSDAVDLVAATGWEPCRVVPDREAAMTLVPAGAGLPTSKVTEAKTHVAAVKR